jgi:DNA-binding PadR family transcriptional regulator
VYAALDRLRDDGLIEQLAIDEADDVPKQHLMRRSYRASRRGKKAYRGWLVDQLRDDPLRIQLLERIISVEVLGVEATLEVVDRYAEVCLEELRALPAATDLTSVGDSGLDQITSSLLEDQQRRELGARYDWAVYARQVLEEHAKESSAAS